MKTPIHPRLDVIFAMTDGVAWGARELMRAAVKHSGPARRKRGATLRPGAGAPLWGALAAAVRPYLEQRGEKAQLARILGVDAARVSEYFVLGSAMPDAERNSFATSS